MPVTFPDGSTAELVYKPELALEDALVVPGWAAGTTPGGVDRDILIRYGTLSDLAGLITKLVSTELVRSAGVVCVYEFRGLYEYLVFQFEDWVLGIHSADDMSPGVKATWSRGLTLRVAPDGFPILESSRGVYFWEGGPDLWEGGPALAFQKGGPGIELRLNVCMPDEDLYESGQLAGYGRRCLPGTSVQMSVNNYAGLTVDEVLQGLEIRNLRLAP